MHEIKCFKKIDKNLLEAVKVLEVKCLTHDEGTLKLELDYRLAAAQDAEYKEEMITDYLYYLDNNLVGYLGICSFGGSKPELNGMVDPECRRQGIFSKLFVLAIEELHRLKKNQGLLLTDRVSESGQGFIKNRLGDNLKLAHSEYEMFLNQGQFQSFELSTNRLLRKASNQDAEAIARQNAIYFNQSYDETELILPETEEKRGMTVYMAEFEGQCIGKIHLELSNECGAIYGVGILPEFRGKGFGRAIIKEGVGILLSQQAKSIKLQVESENENALGLYHSCGFEAVSTMDYYEYNNGSRDYGKSI